MEFPIWICDKCVEGCIHPHICMCIHSIPWLYMWLLFFLSNDISVVSPSTMSGLVVYSRCLWCMYFPVSVLCFRSSMVSLSSTATCCSHTEGLSATAAMVWYIHHGHHSCVCDSFIILSHLYFRFKSQKHSTFYSSLLW